MRTLHSSLQFASKIGFSVLNFITFVLQNSIMAVALCPPEGRQRRTVCSVREPERNSPRFLCWEWVLERESRASEREDSLIVWLWGGELTRTKRVQSFLRGVCATCASEQWKLTRCLWCVGFLTEPTWLLVVWVVAMLLILVFVLDPGSTGGGADFGARHFLPSPHPAQQAQPEVGASDW